MNFDFKQWKILAYAYAEHLLKHNITNWKNQFHEIMSQGFCKEHECLCTKTYMMESPNLIHEYGGSVQIYYCPQCRCYIDKQKVKFIPNYYSILEGQP